MDSGDVIAILAAVISLVSVFFAWMSARSSHRSAVAAEKSADAEHAVMEMERKDRAEAALQRRTNVWHHHHVTAYSVEFKFLGAEAHHVSFSANVVLQVERRKGDTQGPMYKGDRMIVTGQDPEGWNRRVTVSWAEVDGSDAERLSNTYVV